VVDRSADQVERQEAAAANSNAPVTVGNRRIVQRAAEHPPADEGPLGPCRAFSCASDVRKLHTKLTRFLKVFLRREKRSTESGLSITNSLEIKLDRLAYN